MMQQETSDGGDFRDEDSMGYRATESKIADFLWTKQNCTIDQRRAVSNLEPQPKFDPARWSRPEYRVARGIGNRRKSQHERLSHDVHNNHNTQHIV